MTQDYDITMMLLDSPRNLDITMMRHTLTCVCLQLYLHLIQDRMSSWLALLWDTPGLSFTAAWAAHAHAGLSQYS